MELTPEKIYEDYRNKNLDKNSTLELLFSIIENVDSDNVRIESVNVLEKIGIKNDKLFKFLENLLISDASERIRNAAAKVIKNNFIEKALPLLKWTMRYESAYDCIITVIETLVKLNTESSKSILINELEKLKKRKYLIADKKFTNKSFKKDLKKLLKIKKIEEFSLQEIAEILINYKTIAALKEKFYTVYYELENALVTKLDLSDIEYEVRGWKSEFKNNIKDLSEITGLKNLKSLKYLYLANNPIKDIKDLLELELLTHLYISNNNISDIKNLEYLKKMTNLSYLDITGNEIAKKINIHEFNPDLEIKLIKDYF